MRRMTDLSLNAVHSREGCYTYVKEIIDGNSIITLAEEEQQALDAALEVTSKESRNLCIVIYRRLDFPILQKDELDHFDL